jgi:transposase
MDEVIIGVDPHKLSATVEVVNRHEQLLGSGRFTTDKAG